MQRRSHNGIPSATGPMRPDPNPIPADVKTRSALTDFVLYVHNSCQRSRELLDLLKYHPMPSVFVQNVADLRTRPQWLDGVPILADAKIGLIYKGSDAIAFVTNLVQEKRTELVDSAPVRDTLVPRDMGQSQRQFSDISHQPPLNPKNKSPMDDLFDDC